MKSDLNSPARSGQGRRTWESKAAMSPKTKPDRKIETSLAE